MSTQRLTQLLMGLVAILLLANLVRPAFEPATVFAQTEKKPDDLVISGTGYSAWILKNNHVYFVRWDANFRKTQIDGPQELERDGYDPTKPTVMTGTGNSAWVIRGNQVYYVQAIIDNNFVTIEVERPEALPK